MTIINKLYFENLEKTVLNEIKSAQHSIIIASQFFDKTSIFNEIVVKLKNKCKVNILVANHSQNKVFFKKADDLLSTAPKITKLPLGESFTNKNAFCLIDSATLITGNFNWHASNKSADNYIIITEGDDALFQKFERESKALITKYKSWATEANSSINLEDAMALLKAISVKASEVSFEKIVALKNGLIQKTEDEQLLEILKKIDYTIAENLELRKRLKAYLSSKMQINLSGTNRQQKLLIKNIENQLTVLELEKIEMEKAIEDFADAHNRELGELTTSLLYEKAQKSEGEEKDEAEQDVKDYEKELDELSQKNVFEVNSDEKALLKKAFREATFLCHPDKFVDADSNILEKAELIFKELNEANSINDIHTVQDILEKLKNGILLNSEQIEIDSKNNINQHIERLSNKLEILLSDVITMRDDEEYQFIISLKDWDAYFDDVRDQLEEELAMWRKKAKKTTKD